jgi:hypothetical protein
MLTPSTFRMAKAHQDRLLITATSYRSNGSLSRIKIKVQSFTMLLMQREREMRSGPKKSNAPTEHVHLRVR